jgi:putative membrane protein
VLRARKGIFTESDFFLRVFNEVSVLGAIAVLIIVVFKPF